MLALLLPVFLLLSPEDDTRALARALAARDFSQVSARLDDTLSKALPVETLAATWDELLAKTGAFKSVRSVRTETVRAYRVVHAECEFEKGALDMQVAWNAGGRIAGLFFKPLEPGAAPSSWSPPPYVDPARFVEHEVEIGAAPFRLRATLTVPTGAGPYAAAILVHGSGPHDRDETIGPNKPFKDLAWGLASRGVMVLRYEKRTLAHPEAAALPQGTMREETIDDARAAVAFLASRAEVAPGRIVIVGHSQGGYLAPRIAEGEPRIAGLVSLAGNTRPLEDLVVEQLKVVDPGALPGFQATRARIRSPALAPTDTVDFLGARLPGSWFLDLRGYRPAQLAASLRVPVLALQGGRDYQVREADLDGWRKALAGRPGCAFKLYPALGHLFISGTGAPSPRDYEVGGHVDAQVVEQVAAWIIELPRRPAR